jgi:hypothetical protein
MEKVETDFALLLEWDAGVWRTEYWMPEFFGYDYIGAPWPRNISRGTGFDVGNGGFTLMSKKLGHFICENVQKWPVYTDMDVCRTQRPHYDRAGFKWADPTLASCFAWELGPRKANHFGYHGAFTWPEVLPTEEIVERVRVMLASEYLSAKLPPLIKAAPWLVSELSADEQKVLHERIPPGYFLRPNIPGRPSSQQRAAMLIEAQRRNILHAQRRGHIINRPQTGEKA